MNYQEATEFASKMSKVRGDQHVYLVDPVTIRPPLPSHPQYRVTPQFLDEEWLYACTYINGAKK